MKPIEFLMDYPSCLKRSTDEVGTKSWTTAFLDSLGFEVPAGCVISNLFVRRILGDTDVINNPGKASAVIRAADLDDVVAELFNVIVGRRLIIRSSSIFEDRLDLPTYGLYKSIVSTRDDLDETMRVCLESPYSESVVEYKRVFGFPNQGREYMPILAQEFVEREFAGVIVTSPLDDKGSFSGTLELVRGPCRLLTEGSRVDTTIQFDSLQSRFSILSGGTDLPLAMISKIFSTVSRLTKLFDSGISVEFVTDKGEGEEIVILQVRRVRIVRRSLNLRPSVRTPTEPINHRHPRPEPPKG